MKLIGLLGFLDLQWFSPKVTVWLTPIWVIGVGALMGLLTLVLLWGLFALVSRRWVARISAAVREGPLWWIFWTFVVLAAFGVLGFAVARNPRQVIASIWRLPYVGSRTYSFDVDAEDRQKPVDVRFRNAELHRLTLKSDVVLTVSSHPHQQSDEGVAIEVPGGEEYTWTKGPKSGDLFAAEEISRLYVTNPTGEPTVLTVTVVTNVAYPEAFAIPMTASIVLALFLLYFIQQALLPKMSAVALATAKSEMAQPLFLINLALGAFLLALFIWIPYGTFGEDIKVLKDSGMITIMVLAMITALWAASTSVAEEIEGRTALTVLSKPIGRRQFILGKFTGIVWVVVVMFVILGVVFLITVAYKPVYDARESAKQLPSWQECHHAMVQTVPGLTLALMETVVLAALSVAIATRLPMLANFIICFTVYVLGHLTPAIVQSSYNEFEPVEFAGQLLATIVPNLEHFNIQAAVATGQEVPHVYLAVSLLYCILYGTVALLLALVMFEDRDLT